MSVVPLALVVIAALIHASWNLLAKRAASAGPAFVFAYNVGATVAYLPWVIWLLATREQTWSWPIAFCFFGQRDHPSRLQPVPAARLPGR
jgi:hypothetical protein